MEPMDDETRDELRRMGLSQSDVEYIEEMTADDAREWIENYLARHGVSMTVDELLMATNEELILDGIERASNEDNDHGPR